MTEKINMLKNNKYTELIAKKLSGNISKSEDETLSIWLKDSKQNQEYFDIHNSLWFDTKVKRLSKHADNVFIGISAAIQREDVSSESKYQIQKRKIRSSYMWRGIAAALVLLVASVYIFINMDNSKEQLVAQSIQSVKKSLPTGQKMKIFLPDGSTVWLNAESSITYPERFDDENRIVTLTGEAFFDVNKDPLKPFIVKTQNMDITVLGTKFNVNNYQGEVTDVALESGKVMISAGSKKTKYLLAPGEGISINGKSGKTIRYDVDPKLAFQWKDGMIYFDKADFNEVINRLSRWYGVDFIVENYNGDDWVYSAEFKNDYLNNILQSMSFTKGFQYEIDQNIVTLKFN